MINILDTEYIYLLIAVFAMGYLVGSTFGLTFKKKTPMVIEPEADFYENIRLEAQALESEMNALKNKQVDTTPKIKEPRSAFKFKDWDALLEQLNVDLEYENIDVEYYIQARMKILEQQRAEEVVEAEHIANIKKIEDLERF